MVVAANDAENPPPALQPDLFGLQIPENIQLKPRATVADEARPRLMLVRARSALIDHPLALQFHFTWTEEVSASIVSIVDRRGSDYLDIGVYDLFRDTPAAASSALGLERLGIYLVGQLVQLREEDVRILKCVTPKALTAMRQNLESLGLGFGMRLPRWNRASDMLLAI